MARTTFITIITYMMIMMRMKRNLLCPVGHQESVKLLSFTELVNAISADDSYEPTSYKEAMEGPESEKWLEDMKSEIDSMYTNKVWTLVDIPEDRKAVENKWIFKKKD